jgi:hypothetical protein
MLLGKTIIEYSVLGMMEFKDARIFWINYCKIGIN